MTSNSAARDDELVRLDDEVGALTRACLQAFGDATLARFREDWEEVERCQDLADTLSAAADAKQAELNAAIARRVRWLGPHHRHMRLVPD